MPNKLTPERQQELEKEQKDRKHNEIIHKALEAVDRFAEGADQKLDFPREFVTIPATVFLQRTPAELQKLFLNNGVVDFHGNMFARRKIGAGDLFDASQKFISINGRVAQRSIDTRFNRHKIGYVDQTGKYIPILGGETITVVAEQALSAAEKQFVSQPSQIQKDFEYITDTGKTLRGESAYKAFFLAETQGAEVRREETEKEMRETLQKNGIEVSEKMDSKDLFYKYAHIAAQTLENKYGIPKEVTIAMASLESGQGQSGLSQDHKNYFGRIALLGEPSATMQTQENWGNGLITEKRGFKTYNSALESFMDFGELMMTKRYRDIFKAYKKREKYTIPTEYAVKKRSDRRENTEMTRTLETPADVLWAIVASGYATLSTNEYVDRAESSLKAFSKNRESLYT